jgi:hypothetical protein
VPAFDSRLSGPLLIFGSLCLALVGALALAGRDVTSIAPLGTAALSAALVLLAFDLFGVRGRLPVVAVGMIGLVTGVAGAGYDLIGGTTGPFLRISAACAVIAAAAYGLSHPKPRPPMAQAALVAFAVSAVAVGLSAIVSQYAPDLTGLLPVLAAAAWLFFGLRAFNAKR